MTSLPPISTTMYRVFGFESSSSLKSLLHSLSIFFRSMQKIAAVSGSKAIINWPGLVCFPTPAYEKKSK